MIARWYLVLCYFLSDMIDFSFESHVFWFLPLKGVDISLAHFKWFVYIVKLNEGFTFKSTVPKNILLIFIFE